MSSGKVGFKSRRSRRGRITDRRESRTTVSFALYPHPLPGNMYMGYMGYMKMNFFTRDV